MKFATKEFSLSYRRAAPIQATLPAVGLLSSIAAWFRGATIWWVIAGSLLGAVIPFTLIVIAPTNKKLLNPELNRRASETARLLARWALLHGVRSVVECVALLLFLYLVIFDKPL